MATEIFESELDEDAGAFQISGFKTSDPDIVDYFSEVEEGAIEDQVETALRVGVLALRSSTTSQQVDFVEKKFSELRHQFDDQLKLLFGDEGDLKKYIEDHFGEDGKLLKAFDPATEGTPMNILKRKMDTEFEKLRQDLAVAEKGNENVKQRWNGPLNQAREVPDACSGCANALPYDPLMV